MSTLIIAEKSQAAKAIAAALGQSNPIKESKFITVQHIPSKNIYVLPLRGHILSYKNTEEFKSWAKSNPRETRVTLFFSYKGFLINNPLIMY